MAERKTGPVKPPVIDGTARPAAEAKPEAATPATTAIPAADSKPDPITTKPAEASKPSETPKPTKAPEPTPATPKPAASPASARPADKPLIRKSAPSQWPAAAAGTAGGAIIGLALAYGLASAGLWPASNTAAPDDARLQRLEQEVASTNATAQTAITDIAAVSARTDVDKAGLAALATAVEALQATKPADLSGIEANLKTLSDRIDAIGAGASSADAGALAQTLAEVQTSLADVTAKVGALTEGSATANSSIQTLSSDLQSVQTALAAEAQKPSAEATMGPALRLPLVLSSLEAAFSSGRPFAAELASLAQILPDTKVPGSVSELAEKGIADPRTIIERYNTILPDILAARPTKPDAPWNEAAMDWLKNVLVLRPSGDVKGDDPDAVLARLEAAITAGDFTAATALFTALPEPMRTAAGALPQDVKALSETYSFIATLRTSALADTAVQK